MAALVAIVVVGLGAASVTRVPEGDAGFSHGRYLDPGWHLKAPFSAAPRYGDGDLESTIEREVPLADGSRREVTATVLYRWDRSELRLRPVDPRDVRRRLLDALDGLQGIEPGRLASRADRAAEAVLEGLPVEAIGTRVDWPDRAFEELAAAARPVARRTVLIGFDGLDWALLDRCIDDGGCPTFGRMKAEGAWGEIVSHQPVLSPLIWTSIATGRRPSEHGILDFVVSDPETGEDVPITNRFRRVPAFWNVLTAIDRDVDVVNWWATYPAEPVTGTMVSERMFYQLFGITPERSDPANVYPPSALAEIEPLLVDVESIGWERLREFADLDRRETEAVLAAAAEADNPFDDPLNHLRKIIAVTDGVFAIGHHLLAEPPDLLALYVEGTDTIGHRFAHYLEPRLPWVDDEGFGRYRRTMRRYYEWVDAELGRLMEAGPGDAVWLVVTDHGFFTGAARPGVPPDDFTAGAPQWHRMTGAFLASGPDVRSGRVPSLDIYDLARTVLWLQGAPISRELTGREVTELMSDRFAAAHPPVYVDDYERLPHTWKRETRADATDRARMQELAALGYLSAGGESVAAPGPAAAPDGRAGAGDLQAKPTEAYNRGKLALQRGDFEEAERELKRALEIAPRFALAMANLSDVYRRQGRDEEALLWMVRALETGSELVPPTLLLDFVELSVQTGRGDRALGALGLLEARWGGTSTFHTARGQALAAAGRAEAARSAYERALEVDPGDPVATESLLVLARSGVPVEVDAILRRHYDVVAQDLKRLNDFGVVALRQGRPEWAERALRRVLDSDPTNPGVLSNLAAALQRQGKVEDALEIATRSVQLRPSDASLRYNRGALLMAADRPEEALRELTEARRLGLDGPRVTTATAKALFRLGRRSEARQALEEGARRYPGDPEIRELLALLR